MRHLAYATILFCLHTLCAGAEPSDTPATRKEAAERYLAASDLPKVIDEMADVMSRNMSPAQRDEFKKVMTQYVRIDALREAVLIAMVKHFTTRELNALAQFYGSPEGKSAMAKFGIYMADVMPMVEAEIKHAAEARKADKAKTPGT